MTDFNHAFAVFLDRTEGDCDVLLEVEAHGGQVLLQLGHQLRLIFVPGRLLKPRGAGKRALTLGRSLTIRLLKKTEHVILFFLTKRSGTELLILYVLLKLYVQLKNFSSDIRHPSKATP